MYQSSLHFHFESNKEENFTTLLISDNFTGAYVAQFTVNTYYSTDWIAENKDEAVFRLMTDPRAVKSVNVNAIEIVKSRLEE